ncbi:YajG family lipoprotein [Hymenobacter psychrophilus]|uniref:Uncharacterized protein n=1 Tax=Hymenobacter psychrophilus TaxID=651662 RepID=A0A1H3HXJ6_9BACT|nr:hypothetical protein [Hymenobacter psychrophilus]SDY20102.1 hypothetical protein SAMN04488069_106191 [Hymenobacter psychrophilus]
MHSSSKFLLTAVLTASIAAFSLPSQAQVTINVNPPSWGPAVPAGTQYYYIPETGGYYDLRDQQYIVRRDGKWKKLKTINGYSTSSFHPVVINYVGAQPWVLVQEHRVKYPKQGHPQGMPPGQAKKVRAVYVVPAGSPVYVEQDKGHKGHDKGKGHGKGKH